MILITIGISLFIYDEDSNIEKEEQKSVYFGDLLLVISLVFDGITSAFQEKIRRDLKDEPKESVFLIISDRLISSAQNNLSFIQSSPAQNCKSELSWTESSFEKADLSWSEGEALLAQLSKFASSAQLSS